MLWKRRVLGLQVCGLGLGLGGCGLVNITGFHHEKLDWLRKRVKQNYNSYGQATLRKIHCVSKNRGAEIFAITFANC